MAQRTANYVIRTYQPEDVGPVLGLLKQALGESTVLQRTPASWGWKHVSNPFGPSYVRLACDEVGRVVGMRAFMRWKFRCGDCTITAGRAVDTSTHPDYRRRGIFSSLTQQVVEDVQREGVDLIFNTPNEDVLPGYLKLGWHHVATVHPLIKVLNYPALGLGLLRFQMGKPSLRQHQRTEFFRGQPHPVAALLEGREALERLIHQNEQLWDRQGTIRTQRSWDHLRWRYGEHPAIPYWTVFVEEGGELRGCAIFRTNTRFGAKEVVLCELLIAQPDEELCRRLLDQLCSSIHADYLIAYFQNGSSLQRILGRCGFRSVPRRGMNFTVMPLNPALPVSPLDLRNWALSLGDLELF